MADDDLDRVTKDAKREAIDYYWAVARDAIDATFPGAGALPQSDFKDVLVLEWASFAHNSDPSRAYGNYIDQYLQECPVGFALVDARPHPNRNKV